nr:MAG TPA: hypothetical protein [Caudoviricetes sp.]
MYKKLLMRQPTASAMTQCLRTLKLSRIPRLQK